LRRRAFDRLSERRFGLVERGAFGAFAAEVLPEEIAHNAAQRHVRVGGRIGKAPELLDQVDDG
jgi:hypothetical protein